MSLRRILIASIPAFFAATTIASAEPVAYSFDPGHTTVRFCWNHLSISRQCAQFKTYEGEVLYDAAKPENSKVNITFKTDSIETLVPVFNDHMKGDKLFDAKAFPDATFKSTKFERTGEKSGKVAGDLTIKGVTKPVVLDVTLNFDGAHPMSKKPTLGIGATTAIKRTDFGVSQAAPFVSDEVTIDIQTELNKKI
ncbi:YceI family protein [Rhodomicrobium vannielii ATCC 17100]|jgi:polyisoprenoid-binding protein YceI|uniref:YceI family protein n=1 Tax=Rhodomicrobium vannielii (strain ATCC 17100 / DSM 162 / LMG 4299 / NCIMB 10020 / ATH 3.1.1) TaxID=648757 RepID=E3I395_RHOVT|nr:YceI family protein [Rhodomicrobium vannielii]ADP71456.1 YceI family protein [Rhodomicrobium vannielii ATCC 17100]